MQWTMPHRVLQVVAGLLVAVALSAFTLGVVNGPQHGRLPGERAAGARGGSAPAPAAPATDATPLTQERIEGPAPAVPLTPEEKAQADADKAAKLAEAAKLAANGSAQLAAKGVTAPSAAPAATLAAAPAEKPAEPPPPSEEPPH